MSEFQLRLLSALVLIPLTLGVVWFGGWPFAVFIWLGGVLVAWEWSEIVEGRALGPGFWSLAVLVSAVVVANVVFGAGAALIAAGVVGVGVGGAEIVRRRLNWWRLGGILYVGLPVLALLAMRGSAMLGLAATIWLLALVWAGDSAAYATGRLVGGPKLAPKISPGKTWSGAIGGLVASGCVGVLAALVIGGTSVLALAIVSVCLGAVAQVGDLAESAFKRYYAIKDSGNLIPGHGGILDRVDALVVAAVAATALGLMRAGASSPAQGVLIW
ncbi:MAG: phosphatidate cytidylyltransferase [Alphaproteobacteria bacterium]